MREFFKGWKRKIGVVTLVMACVLLAAWINSYESDFLVGYFQHTLISVRGGLIYEAPAQPSSQQSRNFFYLARNLKKYPILAEPFEGPTPYDKWRQQWAGFVVAEYEIAVTLPNRTVVLERNRFYRAPDWSIVLPLTILSGWLLLSKSYAKEPVPHA